MSRIIFGSCSSQHYSEQKFWPIIQSRNATAFVWGGDAVYADDRSTWEGFRRKRLNASPEYLRTLFEEQAQVPGYRALLDTNISVFGTIDDHDFGINNGDNTFPWRQENGFEFVQFLGLPEESAMYQRAKRGRGAYGVQVYDFERPAGERLLSDEEAGLDPDVVGDKRLLSSIQSTKEVAIFVLDIRTNRTPWKSDIPDRFQVDNDGDFLGEDQWKWFETAISRSTATVNIIVTGLQVHPERFYDPNVVENWSGFRKSQHRLYQTLLQPNVQAPILISGDVHKAQLMRKDCQQKHDNGDERIRPLYEITTSGLTHSWGTKVCGRANDNPLCHSPYHNMMFRWLLHIAHWINPWTEILVDYEKKLQYSLEMNVAELDFDWENERVGINILGVAGTKLLEQNWSFQDLTERRSTPVKSADFDQIRHLNKASKILVEDSAENWTCVHHRGIPNPYRFAFGVTTPLFLAVFLGSLPIWLPCILLFQFVRSALDRRKKRKRKMA